MKKYQFTAISGSLRKGSFNTMTLHALQKLAPDGISITGESIADVPLYNWDLHDKNPPQSVLQLIKIIGQSDAFIIVTPEYNYSIPGVLKNVIDFISRSPDKPLNMKAVGILGASPGTLGSARAQNHLRQVLVAVNAQVMNQPQVMIAQADKKFNALGDLTDENTAKHLSKFLTSLAEFSDRFRAI